MKPRGSATVPADAPTGGDPLRVLHETLELLRTERLPGLPPLTGGMVGFLGYDAVRRIERLPELAADDLRVPELVLMLATDLAAFDHHEGAITLIANAVNWDGTDSRVDAAYDDAVARLDRMTAALATPAPSTVSVFEQPEPQFLRRRTTEEFGAGVRRLIEEIEAGEAFQVVLSQRFEMDYTGSPLDGLPDAAGLESEPVHVSDAHPRRRGRAPRSPSSDRAPKRWSP